MAEWAMVPSGRLFVAATALLIVVAPGPGPSAQTPAPAAADAITLNPSVTFQTIGGWEAVAMATQIDGPNYAVHPSWPTDSPILMDLAVNDLGLTRLRIEVRSGVENPADYYQQFKNGLIDRPNGFFSHMYDVVNDNNDPFNTDMSKFHWTELDETIELVVNPFRAKVMASGQTPYFTLCFVDFGAVSAFQQADNPQEYAEFMVATFQHLQSKFGWVPDAVDTILEGDIAGRWADPVKIGTAIVAANTRLGTAGFHPDFVAPSSTSLAWATNNFDALMAVSGVPSVVKTVSYHLYWNNADADMVSLSTKARARGMKTAMNEMIGADQVALSKDLRTANVSSWAQYNLASYFGPDQGGKYYLHDGPAYVPGDRTRYLRQYFRYIRPGAVRIATANSNDALTPVAFINTGGRYVVVVNATSAQSFTVANLPAGTYGIRYTTASATDVNAGDQAVGADGVISTSIPGAGTLTVFLQGTAPGTPSGPSGSFGRRRPASSPSLGDAVARRGAAATTPALPATVSGRAAAAPIAPAVTGSTVAVEVQSVVNLLTSVLTSRAVTKRPADAAIGWHHIRFADAAGEDAIDLVWVELPDGEIKIVNMARIVK